MLVVAVVGTWLLARPSATERGVAERRAQSAANDIDVGGEVVAAAAAAAPAIQDVLDDTHDVLPADAGSRQPVQARATRAQVQQWQERVAEASTQLEVAGSAGTSVNVARNALAAATDQLGVVVDLYDVALDLPPEQAASLLPIIGAARVAAVDAWNTAAIQVDVVSIDSGLGHSHVYLSGTPGQPPPEDGGG